MIGVMIGCIGTIGVSYALKINIPQWIDEKLNTH